MLLRELVVVCVSAIVATNLGGCGTDGTAEKGGFKATRSDGIDKYVRENGRTPIQARRNLNPGRVLGYEAADDGTELFADSFVPLQGVIYNVPADVTDYWVRGTDQTVRVENRDQSIGARFVSALADADVRIGQSKSEVCELHGTSYLEMLPEWIYRGHIPGETPQSIAALDKQPVVRELMRADGFTIRREYESPSIAASVKTFLQQQIGGDLSAGISVSDTGLSIDMQKTAVVIGVRLEPLVHVAHARQPPTTGNYEVLEASPPLKFIHNGDADVFRCCATKDDREKSVAFGGVNIAPVQGVYIDDSVEDPTVERPVGLPVRLDLIGSGRLLFPKFFTNLILGDIPPSEVAFCQVSFRDAVESSLKPGVRRLDSQSAAALPKDCALVTSIIQASKYEVLADFYDVEQAKRYETRLKDAKFRVTRVQASIDAYFDRKDDWIAIGVKCSPLDSRDQSNGNSRVASKPIGELLDGGQLWFGADSPQQLMFRRSRGEGVTQETTPYLQIQPGASSVRGNQYVGRKISLVESGAVKAESRVLEQIFGPRGIYGVDSAIATIGSATVVTLNRDKISRQFPRGVWADTSNEQIVAEACRIEEWDLAVQAVSVAMAEEIAAEMRRRFPKATIEQTKSSVTVRGIDVSGDDPMCIVRIVPLDKIIAPTPQPGFADAGFCPIRSDKFVPLGSTGFGVTVSPAQTITFTNPIPYEQELPISLPVQVQLTKGGTFTGSPTYASTDPSRALSFDVGDRETLEVVLGYPKLPTGSSELACSIKWRLVGRFQ